MTVNSLVLHAFQTLINMHCSVTEQDYTVLVRDLATTLLFLVVFLKFHSEELRGVGSVKLAEDPTPFYSREDLSSNINALFTAVAEIFHCWFSSPVR